MIQRTLVSAIAVAIAVSACSVRLNREPVAGGAGTAFPQEAKPASDPRIEAWTEALGVIGNRFESIRSSSAPKVLYVLASLCDDFLDDAQFDRAAKKEAAKILKQDPGTLPAELQPRAADLKSRWAAFVKTWTFSKPVDAVQLPAPEVEAYSQQLSKLLAKRSEMKQLRIFSQDHDWNIERSDLGVILRRWKSARAVYSVEGWDRCVLLSGRVFEDYDGSSYQSQIHAEVQDPPNFVACTYGATAK